MVNILCSNSTEGTFQFSYYLVDELEYDWPEKIFLGKPIWVLCVVISALSAVALGILIGIIACCVKCSRVQVKKQNPFDSPDREK